MSEIRRKILNCINFSKVGGFESFLLQSNVSNVVRDPELFSTVDIPADSISNLTSNIRLSANRYPIKIKLQKTIPCHEQALYLQHTVRSRKKVRPNYNVSGVLKWKCRAYVVVLAVCTAFLYDVHINYFYCARRCKFEIALSLFWSQRNFRRFIFLQIPQRGKERRDLLLLPFYSRERVVWNFKGLENKEGIIGGLICV